MWGTDWAGLKLAFRQHPQVRALLPQLQQDVVAGAHRGFHCSKKSAAGAVWTSANSY